ncbi:MAG TPA: peptidase U34 [Chloroflexi bacterium]|nr:peptidase U34 [Chloroflexota bacterium]
MCDTLVAVGPATADGSVIVAKNSDREPNEAQALTYLPRAQHAPGISVQCTYIQVPQVEETCQVLLARPFWMWGGEMGANEHGVTIGNEAVFTREPYEKGPGLTGMDMIRLALERSTSARQALDTIVELLAAHGQGGNCGFQHALYYHNSFIIADPREAWVLETVGQFWAAERVRDVRTISNGLTIGHEWDLASPGLVEHAIEKGWCSSAATFHFADCYSDLIYTRLGGCRTRQRRSTELLEAQQGHITPATMMAALRDHGPQAAADPGWNPGRGLLMETLCVHASFGPTRTAQSVNGMVAHLSSNQPTYWLTGTSATCTSIFKPLYLGAGQAGLPDRSILGPEPAGAGDAESLWWTHERLHRAVIRDYATRMPLYRQERDALEAAFLHEASERRETFRQEPPTEEGQSALAFTTSCFQRAAEATARWTESVLSTPVQHRPPLLFSLAWNQFDRQAGLR